MKRCTKCGAEKPLAAFHHCPRYGRQAWCKACRKVYDRAYHAATRELRLVQKRAWKKARIEWGRALKGAPCSDCGGIFHPAAMQWDHRSGTTKLFDVSDGLARYSREAILAEIAKCDLVCANCHAVRTYERQRDVAQPG
jgi:hypothetical protein